MIDVAALMLMDVLQETHYFGSRGCNAICAGMTNGKLPCLIESWTKMADGGFCIQCGVLLHPRSPAHLNPVMRRIVKTREVGIALLVIGGNLLVFR